jgi:hypothetical protein
MGVWNGNEFVNLAGRKKYSFGFNRILKLRYKKAHEEAGIKIKNIVTSYAIYPKSYYSAVANIGFEKDIDFVFIGMIGKNNNVCVNRTWLFPFARVFFTDKSYFKDTTNPLDYKSNGVYDRTLEGGGFIPRKYADAEACKFDTSYFKILARSKFSLCPAGDCPWSMRFYEAIMCKSIPIVKYKWETWRSYEESKLDYKFYLADAKEFIYREDWAEHNYALFMKYHTLESINIKCHTEGCGYIVNSDKKNNNGQYCCRRCRLNKSHGPKCERKKI